MINLLLILFFGILLSFAVKRDFEEVFPPFVFTLLMGLYGIAVLGKAHRSFQLSLFAFLGIWIFYIRKEKRLLPSVGQIREKCTPFPVGFVCYIGVCLVMFYCYHSHFVVSWDDLHYNATFAKDMYYYGTMPAGTASTTHYKDYLPLMQLFYYWGFQGSGGFSEPLMFQYKIALVYTCMLPFFRCMNGTDGIRRMCYFLTALSLPFISLIEILDTLSMDAVMALIFGYTLVLIMREEKRDWFFYYRVMLGLVTLTMVKSIALMFAGICLGVWLFRDLFELKGRDLLTQVRRLFLYLASWAAVFAFWASWKIFCRRNGNAGYLNKMFEDDLSSGAFGLPDYASETVSSILKSLFTMHLNFGKLGFTVFSAFLLGAVFCILMWRVRAFFGKDLCCYLVIAAGFLVYLMFLIYTYLFLFEPWEAESLSSLDRYLGTYVLTLLYVLFYHFYECRWKYGRYAAAAATALLFVTLNYERMSWTLVPFRYDSFWESGAALKKDVSEEIALIDRSFLGGGKILVVDHGGNDLYNRYLDYDLIPFVTEPFNSAESDPEAYAGEVLTKIKDRNIAYVYIARREGQNENMHKLDILMESGPAAAETMYIYDQDTEKLKELP